MCVGDAGSFDQSTLCIEYDATNALDTSRERPIVPDLGRAGMLEREESMWRMVILLPPAVAAVMALGAIRNQVLVAQSAPVTRTMLQQKDLEGAEARELLMYRADFVPGGVLGRHFHPGPELIYVLEGALVLEQNGHPL